MDRSWSARGTSRRQAEEASEGPQLRCAIRRRGEWGATGDMDDRHNSRLKEVDHHQSDAGRELCLPDSCVRTVGPYRLEPFDQLHLRLAGGQFQSCVSLPLLSPSVDENETAPN